MKALRFLLIFIALAALVAGAGGYWAWSELTTPIEHTMVGKPVNIPFGSSTEQTVQKLQADGIIHTTLPLKIYIKLTGAGQSLKAGDYQFASPIAPIAVLKQLEEGGAATAKLTIIEGWTRWDIANAMAAIPTLKLRNANEALALMNDTATIKDLDPRASSLEGYMFPDTYFVQSTTTAKELLESTVKHFHDVWKGELAAKAVARHQSAHEAVTVASIIETEAKLEHDRPIVASVIYNRLQKNIPLSVDCTIIYASKLAGKWRNDGKVYLSDLNRDSPYNSRKYSGLPPAPVSNPGARSLHAAVEPANTGYLYYVREPARNDGAHNFYVDAAGFEVGVQALRNWEQKRDAAAQTTHVQVNPQPTAQSTHASVNLQPAATQTKPTAQPATSALNLKKSVLGKAAPPKPAEQNPKTAGTKTKAAVIKPKATAIKQPAQANKAHSPPNHKPAHSAAKASHKSEHKENSSSKPRSSASKGSKNHRH